MFFVHDINGDGVTGLVDGGFTKRISKGSGAFAAMTVTITEAENGWYSFPLSSTHSDTTGLLTVSFSHASAKRVNLQWRVSARTLDELASPTNITAGTITTVTNLTNLPTIPANWITTAGITDGAFTAAKFAAASLNGKGDWMVSYTQPTGFLAATFPVTVASTTNITAGTMTTTTNLTTNNDKTGYALTAAEENSIADALLARNVAGGSSAGRLVKEALYVLRNKTAIGGGTLTVYGVDDTTSAFTAAVTTAAGNPISTIDPT